MSVPLLVEERALGVLQVLDRPQRPGFSLQEMELLGLFANQAAIALDLLQRSRRAKAALEGGSADVAVVARVAAALDELVEDDRASGAAPARGARGRSQALKGRLAAPSRTAADVGTALLDAARRARPARTIGGPRRRAPRRARRCSRAGGPRRPGSSTCSTLLESWCPSTSGSSSSARGPRRPVRLTHVVLLSLLVCRFNRPDVPAALEIFHRFFEKASEPAILRLGERVSAATARDVATRSGRSSRTRSCGSCSSRSRARSPASGATRRARRLRERPRRRDGGQRRARHPLGRRRR